MSMLSPDLAKKLVEFALGHGIKAEAHAALLEFLDKMEGLPQLVACLEVQRHGRIALILSAPLRSASLVAVQSVKQSRVIRQAQSLVITTREKKLRRV